IYKLFFATNHPLGHRKMKEAMWKTDDTGNFRFSDGIDPNQRVLFSNPPDIRLAEMLSQDLAGRTMIWEEVSKHVSPTVYLDKHAKAALRCLEKSGDITVASKKRDGSKRMMGTFPDGTVIRFPIKED
ncbi:hypothetical protein IIA16_04730, partial [bacterium]|nr:hypothetical protein [bacterium]